MPLDDTASGAAANAYCDEEFAADYFTYRLNSDDWFEFSDKPAALITATRLLEQKRFVGAKTTTTAALKWPRSGVFDEDLNEYDEDVIPVPIKQACCELAVALIGDPDLLTGGSDLNQFSSIQLDQATKFDLRPGGGSTTGFPSQVTALLNPFLLSEDIRVIRA